MALRTEVFWILPLLAFGIIVACRYLDRRYGSPAQIIRLSDYQKGKLHKQLPREGEFS